MHSSKISSLILLIFLFKLCGCVEIFTATVGAGGALLTSLGLGAYEYINCNWHECCNKNWIRHDINAEELSNHLKLYVYGQHLAISSVVKHVTAHMRNESPAKALAISLHGWTGTGKNFISQMIASYIYKNGMTSAFVHLISAAREYPHNTEEHIRQYKTNLKNVIESRISRCDRSLFIIDEVDHMPYGVLDVIKPYLEYYNKLDGVTYRRAMFFFLSNSGGSEISNFTLEYFRSGKERESITLKDLEKSVSLAAFNVDNKAGLWHSQLVTKHLITAYVPFLPLERRHVKQCTRDIMATKNFTQAEFYNNFEAILDELTYYPRDEQRFSITGCKRVAEKIDFVMAESY